MSHVIVHTQVMFNKLWMLSNCKTHKSRLTMYYMENI